MLRMNGSSCARIGPPEAPRYLLSRSLATPAHFSPCEKTWLLFFQWKTICRSPVPYNQMRRDLSSSLRQGPLSIEPLGGPPGSASMLAATPSKICRRHRPISLTGPKGAIAPSQTDKRRVRNQQLGVEVVADSQAVACQAHALRAVEAEQLRAGRLEPDPAGGAGIIRRQQPVGPPFGRDDDRPLPAHQGLFDGFDQPATLTGTGIQAGTGLEPVDHDLDLMLDLAVERQVVGQIDHLTVHPGPNVAGLGQVGEQVFIFALLAADHGCQHQE